MDKFLTGFIKVEKSLQIFALAAVVLLLGHLGWVSDRSNPVTLLAMPSTSLPSVQK